jgi:putative CocE/NonD family hydrolase
MTSLTTAALRRAFVLGGLSALASGVVVGTAGAGASLPGSARPAAVRPDSGAPKVLTARKSLVSLTPRLPASVIRSTSSANSHWRPGKARYGTASHNNIAVKGAGGTVIRVNEIYPTTRSGKPAPGKFPVVLTMTPYGKGSGGSSAPGSAAAPGGGSVTGGANNYLVQRGYINVVEDVRGTGDSEGRWGLFDPIQQRDAIHVLHWAAHLPHSDGRVGTYGPSYLGIDQMLLAGTVGRHSPLKAIFPVVSANDIYRDTSYMGGLLDAEFDAVYFSLTGALNSTNPLFDTMSDPSVLSTLAKTEADHVGDLASYHASFTERTLAGSPTNFDQRYWKRRAPGELIKRIVANRIPAFLVGGEFDIFQRGEPLNFAALQNAWAHRPVNAPMRPGQPVTGRYQLIDGPWEHINASAVKVDRLELEWFDTWLKHKKTGMATTPTPLHYYDLGSGKFVETTDYPFTHSTPTRFYLGPHRSLLRHKPTRAGTTSIHWQAIGSPCGRPLDQWVMGGISIPAHSAGPLAPCADGDALSQLGPGVATFTTKPFARSQTLAGPISATLYATATTRETQWVAQVEEVTRGGRSYPLSEGALLGSLRAVDAARSWRSHGVVVMPFHPYTKASQREVVPGKLTRYQIEIFPTLATIAKGDRLRLTIATVDSPHLTPLPDQLPKLVGGVYAVARSKRAPSALTVLLRRP